MTMPDSTVQPLERHIANYETSGWHFLAEINDNCFWVLFSAAMLLVGRQEGHTTGKRPVPLIFKSSFLEQVEEKTEGKPVNLVDLENGCLNRTALIGLRINWYWYAMCTINPFSGLFSRTTWVSQHQKGKIILDVNEARDNEIWH